MSLSQLTTDLNIIQALPNQPNSNDGLTPAELKAEFDEAGNVIKLFINGTLISELSSVVPGSSGADHIGSAPILGVTGATVFSQLSNIYSQLSGIVLGQIPDNTITPIKLTFDPATKLDSVPSRIYAYRNNGGF